MLFKVIKSSCGVFIKFAMIKEQSTSDELIINIFTNIISVIMIKIIIMISSNIVSVIMIKIINITIIFANIISVIMIKIINIMMMVRDDTTLEIECKARE